MGFVSIGREEVGIGKRLDMGRGERGVERKKKAYLVSLTTSLDLLSCLIESVINLPG